MDNAVKTSKKFPIPKSMKAWVLGNPSELKLIDKNVPLPNKSEVLIRIDAVAICATDLDVISHGPPAMIEGGLPFNKNFTPGHEYMGTIVALGPSVDEFQIGDRVTVEIHSGCGQCKRCRMGMYTSCHNYGLNFGDKDKGHRANGFTSDGGFKQYAINHINTLIKVPDEMTDEEATLVVTAGTTMYGLTELGGLVSGESLVVIDDSIVRGTTLRESILKILARTEPKKIVVVSSAPQIRYPDCYGIDMSELGKFIAFQAAIDLLKNSARASLIAKVYDDCLVELRKPYEEMRNCVRDIYKPFSAKEISEQIARLVYPQDIKWKGEVEVIYQSVENLKEALGENCGDWYFTGNYPTPAGTAVANRAFTQYCDGIDGRPYDLGL